MILDGKLVAYHRNLMLKERIKEYLYKKKRPPGLAIIIVGNDPASVLYVNKKIKAGSEAGIKTFLYNLPPDNQDLLKETILKINKDKEIDGVIIQLPLPLDYNADYFLDLVDKKKDVDGFSVIQQGNLFQNREFILSATPLGVINLLDYYRIDVYQKKVAILGTSRVVGLPLGLKLLHLGATVTFINTNSPLDYVRFVTRNADIVISAAGVTRLIGADDIKKGAIVIDIGINFVNGKTVGDVDFEAVKNKASYITPVPGGVGPMTVNALLENVVLAYEKHYLKRYY